MKKWILGLLVLALCVGPASASSIGFFVSSYAPDDTDAGEGFGIDVEFGSKVEFELRIGFYGDLYTDAKPLVYRIETSPLDLGVNYNFDRGSRVTPYIGGGFSYVNFDFDGDTSRTTGQPRGAGLDSEFGSYGQVGLDFDLNTNWKVSAELIYRYVQAEIESDDLGLPLDQKLSTTGPALNIGLAVQW